MEKSVLLFDGVCHFCNSTVKFVLNNDSSRSIYFASLQSVKGKELIRKYQLPEDISTVVLIHNNRAFTKSTAAIKTMLIMGGIFRLAAILYIFPRFLRDWGYGLFASKRYKWFGKYEQCTLPTQQQKSRFL